MNDQDVVRCEHCGDRLYAQSAVEVDVSREDEYYPKFIYLCPQHTEGSA